MGTIVDGMDGRTPWLILLLSVVVLLSFFVLSRVFWTIFLAASFAYVLYPLKRRVRERGFSDRQSAAAVTCAAFVFLIAVLAPLFLVLFRRRHILIDFINNLPNETTVELLEFSFVIQTAPLEVIAREWVTATAFKLAESLPALSIKFFLLVFLLYAILRYPRSIESKLIGMLPTSAEPILYSYHERIKETLVGIFAVQTLTSVLTFLIALPVFYFLGYGAFVSLALISAILQFIPIVGPAVLIIPLAALERSLGFPGKALMILVFGLVIVGFLPDAYLRPRLAGRTTGLPASLYFVGFAGGALTLGAIGVLAGPLMIAILLETVDIITE